MSDERPYHADDDPFGMEFIEMIMSEVQTMDSEGMLISSGSEWPELRMPADRPKGSGGVPQ